jgi:hypothetical protein
MGTKITPSSGHVFADLGFSEDEAEHLRIRSTLMGAVRKLIEGRKLTQAEAALAAAPPGLGFLSSSGSSSRTSPTSSIAESAPPP